MIKYFVAKAKSKIIKKEEVIPLDHVQHFPDEEEHLRKIEAVLSEELGRNELAVKDASLRFEEAQKEHQDNYYDMDTRERLAMDGMLKRPYSVDEMRKFLNGFYRSNVSGLASILRNYFRRDTEGRA